MGAIKQKNLISRLFSAMRPGQIIAAGFAVIILVGAVLLTLPAASKTGAATPFFDALFTATSATCVTGLVVHDTATWWSPLGQAVILVLIQTGGLGFMTVAVLISFAMRRKITLRERLILAESFNRDKLQGIVSVTRKTMLITFAIELAGALCLAIRFVPQFGAAGVWYSVFIAVSAFCNAGFDLMGARFGQYSSLTAYSGDVLVNTVVMLLIIIGGVGFFVLRNLYRVRRKEDVSVQTKLVAITTLCLVLGGAALFFALEYGNTLGAFSLKDKILAALFQSVTARTAGFNSIDQAALGEPSKLVTALLMFIGGSPGSTAGGIKTVTFAVLVITTVAFIKNRHEINVFGKSVSKEIIMRSVAIIAVSAAAVIVSSLVIMVADNMSAADGFYMAVSAMGTVGLALTDVGAMSPLSRLVLLALMYSGRIGSLALVVAVSSGGRAKPSAIMYPEARITVG